MKKLHLYTLSLLFASLTVNVMAQGTIKDANGVPMRIGKYVEVDGDPFLDNDWHKGYVMLANGTSIKDVNLKLDIVSSDLLFQSNKGEALVFVDPVKEFTLTYPGSISNTKEVVKRFKNGYSAVDNAPANTFYQVLFDGTVGLLKRVYKTINEQRRYDSSITSKTFQENTKYYMVINGKAMPVKNDKKAILTLLKDKQQPLEIFIKDNKINFKDDNDLSKLLSYYNSI